MARLARPGGWVIALLALAPFGLPERDKSAICLALTRVVAECGDFGHEGRDALVELKPTAQDRAQIIEMLIAILRAGIGALPPAPGYPAPENPHWPPRLAPVRLEAMSLLATFAVTTDERSRAHTGLAGLIESVNDLGWTPLVPVEGHATGLGSALERGMTMLDSSPRSTARHQTWSVR
jgi:hypothetical protein